MGSGEVADVVADSGPLIHLHEADCLALVGVFASVRAPEEVWREVVGQGHVAEDDLLASHVGREPHPSDIETFVHAEGLRHLDRGEQECLQLCRRLGVSIILTDDLAARDAAKRLAITPVGSLGVIVRAFRLGHVSLDEAERLLRRLRDDTTLFVTPAIVDLAVEQLRSRR